MSDKNFGDYTDRDKQTESIKIALEQMNAEELTQKIVNITNLSCYGYLTNDSTDFERIKDLIQSELNKAKQEIQKKHKEQLEEEVKKAYKAGITEYKNRLQSNVVYVHNPIDPQQYFNKIKDRL